MPLLRVGETHRCMALFQEYLDAVANAAAAKRTMHGDEDDDVEHNLANDTYAAASLSEAAGAAASLAERVGVVLARARQHGFSGGCELVRELLEEYDMRNARISITYLSLLPLHFTTGDGTAATAAAANESKVGSELPHFVELLVTRAVGTEGFATGGLMRSPPGETMSWSSHGVTIMSVMHAMARRFGFARLFVDQLRNRLDTEREAEAAALVAAAAPPVAATQAQ